MVVCCAGMELDMDALMDMDMDSIAELVDIIMAELIDMLIEGAAMGVSTAAYIAQLAGEAMGQSDYLTRTISNGEAQTSKGGE